MPTGTLTAQLVGRLSGALWVVCGLVVAVGGATLDHGTGSSSSGVVAVGAAAVAVGLVVWEVPWRRWHRSATLWLVPLALGMITLLNAVMADDGFVYATFFFVVFVWVGLGHPRGTSLRLSPLLAAAYVLPLVGPRHPGTALGSALFVVPACVVVGEAVAWVGARLRGSESELVEAEERFRSAFEQAPIGMGLASPEGRLVRVNGAYARIVGSSPEQLVGISLGEITHPDDWQHVATQFHDLASGKIDRYQVEKRCVNADGRTVWVTVSATCARDGDGNPIHVIEQVEDVTERREMRERLAHAAVHDQLTGLPNRVLFMDRLELALSRSRREQVLVAIMFLDLDRFTLINDSLGHDVGDQILAHAAQRLRGTLRSVDALARFGGDEFTVLCEVADRAEAVDIAERLVAAMHRPLTVSGIEMFVSLSAGIALSADGTEPAAALLRNADVAMYRAKELGPSRVSVYEADDERHTILRLRTSNDLHRALEREELELHFQPMVDLRDDSLLGMEALVRWQHPTRGLLLPAQFIPLAEDSGLIVSLGAWVLREACRQVAQWQVTRTAAGQDDDRLNVSVNVSAQQLADPTFPRHVRAALEAAGLDPDKLWLEITESTLMATGDATEATLPALRDLGLHLEIDDFGTGYSSLSYLKRLPVEVLKVDRSFVDELDCDSDDVAIVRAIVALGESLGLAIVAEGVERRTQAVQLQELGCHIAQGFLFGVPLPASALGDCPTDDLGAWLPRVRSA